MTTFVVSDSGGWVALGSSGLPSSGVTAGTYGDSTHVAQVTVNAAGQVTAASAVAIAGAGSTVIVTDGTTSVVASTLDFTSGATVTDAGGGVAHVAVSGGGGGGLALLFDSTLGADTANIDATGLSGAYKNLLIYISARSTRAGISVDQVGIRFNGDTGSNYYYEALIATGSGAVSSSENRPVSSAAPSCPAATATAGFFAGITVDVNDYASTAHIKNGNWRSSYIKSTSAGDIVYDAAMFSWNNTAAITQVTIFALNGNLKAGSRLTIYGTP